MARLPAERRTAEVRGRILAIAFSVGVHAALLAVFARELSPPPPPPASAVIDVELSRSWPSPTRRPPPPAAASKPPSPRAAAVAVPRNLPPAPTLPSPPPEPPATPAAARPSLAEGLRGSLGCDQADLFHLSPSERQDCRDRLAQGRHAGVETAEFGIDPDKRAAYDTAARRAAFLQQPFLAEKPKKGCRPNVAEQNIPAPVQARNWSVSLACTIPF